jgi:hypothetical protein
LILKEKTRSDSRRTPKPLRESNPILSGLTVSSASTFRQCIHPNECLREIGGPIPADPHFALDVRDA